jgi:hypothetical protein
MNEQLQTHARDILKEGLAQCSNGEQLSFKRMYSHNNLDMPIDEVIDNMEPDRLDWAMDQVRRTLDKKTNGGGPS